MLLPLHDVETCRRVLQRAKGATAAWFTLSVLAVLCLLTSVSYHLNRSTVALREAKLSRYRHAVEEWAAERQEFQKLGCINISVQMLQPSVVSSSEPLFNGTLEAVAEPDHLRDPQADQLLPYVPLRYTLSTASERVVELPWRVWTALVEVSYRDSHRTVRALSLPLELTRAVDVACSGWKTSTFKAQAISVASRCLMYQKVAAVCLRLHREDQDRWQLLESSGCQGPSWAPVSYQEVELERFHPPTTVTLKVPFPITVRADSDPWEVASALTAGSLNFGITQQEHDNVVRLLFVAALGCLGVCGVLFVCFATECGYYEGGEGDEPLMPASSSYLSSSASVDSRGDVPLPTRMKKKKSAKHVVLVVNDPSSPQATSTGAQLWPGLGLKGAQEIAGDHEMAVTTTSAT
eukprot:GGOE01014140.1.p1 GENE.GGOE01014140.1~~GGOE01014140.1.p1  ORF type:complete len:407 (-),score=72.02 GGOE01014140.1:201-1421(-)